MSDTFTQTAKKCIYFAYDEAKKVRNMPMGPEHLLLGIIRERPDLFKRVDTIALKEALGMLIEKFNPVSSTADSKEDFSEGSKEVFKQADAIRLSLGHSQIGTAHLLFALLRNRGNLLTFILNRHGLSEKRVLETMRVRVHRR